MRELTEEVPRCRFVVAMIGTLAFCGGAAGQSSFSQDIQNWAERFAREPVVSISWAIAYRKSHEPRGVRYHFSLDESKYHGTKALVRSVTKFDLSEPILAKDVPFRVEDWCFKNPQSKPTLMGSDMRGRLADVSDGWTKLTPLPRPDWYDDLALASGARYPGFVAWWIHANQSDWEQALQTAKSEGGKTIIRMPKVPFELEWTKDSKFGLVLTRIDQFQVQNRSQISSSTRFFEYVETQPNIPPIPKRLETWMPTIRGTFSGDASSLTLDGPLEMASQSYLVRVMPLKNTTDADFDLSAITGLPRIEGENTEKTADPQVREFDIPNERADGPLTKWWRQRDTPWVVIGTGTGVALLILAVVIRKRYA